MMPAGNYDFNYMFVFFSQKKKHYGHDKGSM